jgi:hypothetical protein
VTEPIEWKITKVAGTPMDWSEDTGYNLVWIQDPAYPNDPTKQLLTLPITYLNDAHRAFLMQLDMGRGPEFDEFLNVEAHFQLSAEVITYVTSLTQMLVLTRDPHDFNDRIEVSEGLGSNTVKTPEHHAARYIGAVWRHALVGQDLSDYRYLSLMVAASSTLANNGSPPNPYLTVNRDYGRMGFFLGSPVYA